MSPTRFNSECFATWDHARKPDLGSRKLVPQTHNHDHRQCDKKTNDHDSPRPLSGMKITTFATDDSVDSPT